MRRTPVWKQIESTLENEIAAGHYRPGDRLPTEAALARRFGVNRHTVRRALAALEEEGLLLARRGSGVFVAVETTEYRLRRRTRFRQNLAEAGRSASVRFLGIEERLADRGEAEALRLPDGARVLIVDSVGYSDETPLTVGRSVFPIERLPDFASALSETGSVTEALRRAGVPDYTRASTRLSAERCTATQAIHLQCAEGTPLLRAVAINIDAEGRPVEYGRTWFAGDRVQLVVEPG